MTTQRLAADLHQDTAGVISDSTGDGYMYAAVWLAMYVCDHFPNDAAHLIDEIRGEVA